MTDYQHLYARLFNALTDALEAMENQDFGTARSILVRAQQETEEIYMD